MNGNYNENYNNKYNLDPKYIKCAGCPKPAGLRRTDGSLFSAYRGRNNEELCHKCACCYHCGKKEKWDIYRKKDDKWEVEEDYGMPSYHRIDKDNPSGGWNIAFCLDCHHNKGFETFRYYDEREYWKVDGVMFNPEAKREWNNFENYKRAHEKAQEYWNSLSSSEREKECERVVENLKLRKHSGGKMWEGNKDMEGYGSGWACDGSFWGIKNGKYVSSKPHLVPCEITEEFLIKMFGDVNSCKDLVLRDYKIITNTDQKDNENNSPVPNLTTNSDSKSDNSVNSVKVNPGNSPQPNPGKDNNLSETENNTIRFENKENENKDKPANSNENSPAKNDDKVLVIDLKNVKWISLTAEGNLVIEFKSEKSENSSEIGAIQKITAKEINNNQELQKVKDYFQKTGKSSLNQQELNSLIQNKTNPAPVNSTENPGHSKAVWISVSVGISLTIGIVIGLLMKRKKKAKKIR